MKNLISTKVLTILLIVIVAFLALSKLSLQGKRKKHFVKKTRKNKNNVFNDDTNDTNDDNNSYVSDDSDDSNKTDDSDDSAKFFPDKMNILKTKDSITTENTNTKRKDNMFPCLNGKIKYLEEVVNTLHNKINYCETKFSECKESYQELLAIAYQISMSMYKNNVYEKILIIKDKKILYTLLKSSINFFSGVSFNLHFKFSDPKIREKLNDVLKSIKV